MKVRIKNCCICGKEFLAERNRISCSPECSAERKRQVTREAARKQAKKVSVTNRICICKWCGKEYARTKTSLYCSEECRYQSKKAQAREYYQRKKAKGEKRPSFGRELVCECCGKAFTTRHTRKYCSEECARFMSREKSKAYNQRKRDELKLYGTISIASNAQLAKKRHHEAEITATAAAAKDAGMSYGQYVAIKHMERTGCGRVQV